MEFVTSADGTRIAFERSGDGPPLVLVHGSLNDRNVWGMVRPAFQQHYTVFAMDRRGRGESGPIGAHDLRRQFEDVAAVIEAAGAPVDLIGHSYGAHCSIGAAAMMPDRVKHLVLYEPPTPTPVRLEVAEMFEQGDPSEAVENFMRIFIQMPEEQIVALKATSFWTYLTSFARTMPPEGQALVDHGFDAARYRDLTMPALFLVGSQTASHLGEVLRQLRTAMPQAEWVELEGQGHAATMTAPKQFAETVLEFLSR